jgi:hypothetical protein
MKPFVNSWDYAVVAEAVTFGKLSEAAPILPPRYGRNRFLGCPVSAAG